MRKQELHPRTAVVNKSQKNHSKKSRLQALVWLAETFPAAFDNSLRIQPLKTGIMNDILEYAEQAAQVGISKSKLREAVVLFTRRIDYLTCLKAREMRIDLNGNPINEVTEADAEHAAAKIKKRVEKSARNARHNAGNSTKSPHSPQTQPSYPPKNNSNNPPSARSYSQSSPALDDFFSAYPSRSAHNTAASPKAAVIVKNKTSRPFDPNAVARLKEKLGLSRSEKKEEILE